MYDLTFPYALHQKIWMYLASNQGLTYSNLAETMYKHDLLTVDEFKLLRRLIYYNYGGRLGCIYAHTKAYLVGHGKCSISLYSAMCDFCPFVGIRECSQQGVFKNFDQETAFLQTNISSVLFDTKYHEDIVFSKIRSSLRLCTMYARSIANLQLKPGIVCGSAEDMLAADPF